MKTSANFQQISFWLDPPPISKSFSTGNLPEKTQVLVIGSGYTGTTAAIRLRQALVPTTGLFLFQPDRPLFLVAMSYTKC